MKSRGGKSQRREEKKKEDQGRERVRRQKMQVREKVAKSCNTVFFQWFVAPESRKVGSLKRRVRSHVVRWEMRSCTPLWREAYFQVKMYKATNEVVMSKKCTPSWRKAHFKVKSVKNWWSRTAFGSWDVEKVYATVARSTFAEDLPADAFRVAGAVQETCSSEMLGGQGADFLRGVAFWSIRSSGLQRWFCVTGAALRMTWHHFFVAGAIL